MGSAAAVSPKPKRPPRRHPFEAWLFPVRRRVLGIAIALSALMLWAFWWLGPRGTTGGVVDLAAARSVADAMSIVDGWTRTQTTIARWVVALDFLFIPVYVTAISLACLWPLVRKRALRRVGRWAAWVIPLGGIADVIENVALLNLISNPASADWIRVLRVAFVSKWVIVAITGACGLVVLAMAAVDWFRGERIAPTRDIELRQEIKMADLAVQSSPSARIVRVTPSAIEDPSPAARLVAWLKGQRLETAIHAPEPAEPAEGQLGVSLSGGGIRSAALCLGALQELDRNEELKRARYLTAVSGGSYIAAAHEILRSREPAGDDAPWGPGTPEEEYLRNRTNYLAPGLGGMFNALWRLIRGLSTNVALIGSVLCVSGFVFGAFVLGPHLIPTGDDCPRHAPCDFTLQRWVFWTMIGLVVASLVAGLWDLLLRPAKDAMQRFLEAWSIRLLLLAGAVALFLWFTPWLLVQIRDAGTVVTGGKEHLDWGKILALAFGWAGSLAALSGVAGLSALGFLGRKGDSNAEPSLVARAFGAIWRPLKGLLIRLSVAVLGPLLAFLVFLAFAFTGALRSGVLRSQVTFALAVAFLVWVLSFGDLTRWSLHPYYKRRLSSVFALERVELPGGSIVAREVPYDTSIRFTELTAEGPQLVVCAAANVSDHGAAPVGRRVVPFTFSRESLYAGRVLGELAMADYQQAAATHDRDISVRAAVAMSGAAVSPSMGKHSRWWATFLLAVANVRLGVWLPNPRAVQREAAGGRPVRRRAGPGYLARELLGRNSYRDDYVYVTDGGHYENLGLVELLRRGCTEIYCFDAAGDKVDTFNTFGEAVAIARSELGVEIAINPWVMQPGDGSDGYVPFDHTDGELWFEGDRSAGKSSGRIVLVKAGVTIDAPSDVRAWKEREKDFPTHGTASQLYTEERFEAYRALGGHMARHAIAAMTGAPAAAGEGSAGDRRAG
jgi:hypothetical protein